MTNVSDGKCRRCQTIYAKNVEAMTGDIGPHQALVNRTATAEPADENEPLHIQDARKEAKVVIIVVSG